MADSFRVVSMRQLQSAVFNARSPADSLPLGAFSWKQNFSVSPDGKLEQAKGFVKPYSVDNPCDYKNWDFHNQGVAVADREPMTFLFASTANDGVRRLFLGTKTRLLQQDESTGQPVSIGSGYGNDGEVNLTQTRWYGAELQNKLFVTNNVDEPQYHVLGSTVMQPIPSLATAGEDENQNAVPLTKAARILQWQGLIFLFNTEEGGVRYASRIRWSDLNDGTNFVVGGGGSVSDFQDLTYGQKILNATVLGGSMYVWTDVSVWRCNLSIDLTTPAITLSCAEVYSEYKNQAKCLVYPNSLVNTGFSVFYAGRDAFYEFNAYLPEPSRVEWIYASSNIVFDEPQFLIDKNSCQSLVGEFVPERREIHWSWPVVEAVLVDDGEEIDCTTFVPNSLIESSGINRHTLVAAMDFKTTDYRDYGSTALVNFRSDILGNASCNQSVLFLGANGTDFCLKQFGVGYAREIFNPTAETYSMVGYVPLLRFLMPFDNFDRDKLIRNFLIDASPESNTTALFKLRIGTSDEAVEVNKNVNNCGVLWHTLSSKVIKCHSTKSPTASVAQNTKPVNPFEWGFLFRSKFLYAELKITNADGSPATVGGVSISRFEVSVVAV